MSEASTGRFGFGARSEDEGRGRSMLLRVAVAVLLLIAGGVIAIVIERLLTSGPAPNEVRVTTFQDWRVVCPPLTPATPNCALLSDVQRDTGGILLTIGLNDPAIGTNLSLTVPHGVLLTPGLGFTIAAEPTRVRPYETCTVQGCIALVTLDADTLKSLTANKNGQVAVAAPNSQQPVNIPFSLNGFAEGYGELQRAKSRRTGFFSFLSRS